MQMYHKFSYKNRPGAEIEQIVSWVGYVPRARGEITNINK